MEMEIFLVIFLMAAMMQFFVVIILVWLLRKRQMWPLIMAGIKGSGTLLFKSHYNGSITTEFTNKPIKEVGWKILDKQTGKARPIVTFLTHTYHHLKGSAIAVHFCPITYPHNIDLNTKEATQLDVEKINAKMVSRYTLGLYDALSLKKIAGMNLQQIELILLIIVIIILCVNAWFTYNVLGIVGTGGA